MTNNTIQQYKVLPPTQKQLASMTLPQLTSSMASLRQALQSISEYMNKHLKDAGYTAHQSYSVPRHHTDGHSDMGSDANMGVNNYTPTSAPSLFEGHLVIVDSTLEDEFGRGDDLSTEDIIGERERLDLLTNIRNRQQD